MFRKTALSLLFLALAFVAPQAHATDIVNPGGGVLSHIVSGGPWTTVITLVNLSGGTAPWSLFFIGDNGQAITVSTTLGTNSVLSGTLTSGGSVIIQTTGDPSSSTQSGWAYVLAPSTQIAGSAVFRLNGNPFFEASLPLDTDTHTLWAMPVDELNAKTGFAIVNSYNYWAAVPQNSSITVTLTFYNQDGSLYPFTDSLQTTDSFQMQGLSHQAFMLQDKYPRLAGKQGLLLISITDTQNPSFGAYANVLGLRANGGGFTSITPIVLQGW
jgi:hypothetical protein